MRLGLDVTGFTLVALLRSLAVVAAGGPSCDAPTNLPRVDEWEESGTITDVSCRWLDGLEDVCQSSRPKRDSVSSRSTNRKYNHVLSPSSWPSNSSMRFVLRDGANDTLFSISRSALQASLSENSVSGTKPTIFPSIRPSEKLTERRRERRAVFGTVVDEAILSCSIRELVFRPDATARVDVCLSADLGGIEGIGGRTSEFA